MQFSFAASILCWSEEVKCWVLVDSIDDEVVQGAIGQRCNLGCCICKRFVVTQIRCDYVDIADFVCGQLGLDCCGCSCKSDDGISCEIAEVPKPLILPSTINGGWKD